MATKRQTRRRTAARAAVAGAPSDVATADAVVVAPSEIRTASLASSARQRAQAVVAHRAFPVTALVAMVLVSAIVNAALAVQQRVPNLFPDELLYGKLAQNLAWGDGLTWRGLSWGLPPLWPAVLSLAWRWGSVPEGYETAKVFGSVLASTAAIPVWLLGRRLLGARLALIPAAFCLIGTWMQVTQVVASENLAFPLATASLMATVQALRDMRLRWILISLAFAVPAALTRTQLLALPVILVLALIIDVLRQPRAKRRARIAARPRALWIGLLTIVALGLLAFVVKPDLAHYGVLATHASVGRVASTAHRQFESTLAMFAIIPVAVAAAMMVRRDNWRDERIGPVLATFVAATVVLFPLIVRFDAFATRGAAVERYLMYLAPLVFILLVMAPGHVSRKVSLGAAGVLLLSLLSAPVSPNYMEQPALFGLQRRAYDIGHFSSGDLKWAVFVFAVPVTIGGIFALTSQKRRSLGMAIGFTLVAAVLLLSTWTSRSFALHANENIRSLALPPQMDWLDRYADAGPVGLLAVGRNPGWRHNLDLYTEFFNRKATNYYSTLPISNGSCDVDFAKDGRFRTSAGRCAAWPRDWVLTPGPYTVTLEGQRSIANTGYSGTLVRLPRRVPRLFSVIAPPCTRFGCSGEFNMSLYLAHPAKVAVTFSATNSAHQVQAGGHVQTLPAGRPTTLNFQLPKGVQSVNVPVSWQRAAGSPELQSVLASTGGKTYRVY